MPLQRFRSGVRHIGLQLRQNGRPLTETLQEIAAYVLPHFHAQGESPSV